MSTAGRPTYHSKAGGQVYSGIRTAMKSGKDQSAHTKLKFRQFGQSSKEEVSDRDFKAELQSKEQIIQECAIRKLDLSSKWKNNLAIIQELINYES